MKPVLPLFIMIDACGWEIIEHDPFARAFAPQRKKLTSVFGYSSACIPSIVSGRWPAEHRNWCYFVYDPEHSPFKRLRLLRWLPRRLTSRRLFRRWLGQFVKAQLNFRGYFDLYNIPFQHISLFDFTEKKSPLKPNGMNRGENIFDFLEQRHIPYYVSDPAKAEVENLADLTFQVRKEQIHFGFLYWPELDGLLHRVGNKAPEIPAKLRQYEHWIHDLLAAAQNHYEDVQLFLFSDHGMANCDELLDLKAGIEALPLRMGEDYAAVYDSTMARFWFFHPSSAAQIRQHLEGVSQGRILSDEDLREWQAFFPDHYFGELIFLVNEGVLIVPSHMGERPLRAMHGYHPAAPQSYAVLCTNQPSIPDRVVAIPHIFQLMTQAAESAQALNNSVAPWPASRPRSKTTPAYEQA
jgi:hypothetical protein